MTTIKTYMLTFYKKNNFHNFSYRHSLWPPGLRLRTFIEIDGSVCKISGGNVGSGIHVHFNPGAHSQCPFILEIPSQC